MESATAMNNFMQLLYHDIYTIIIDFSYNYPNLFWIVFPYVVYHMVYSVLIIIKNVFNLLRSPCYRESPTEQEFANSYFYEKIFEMQKRISSMDGKYQKMRSHVVKNTTYIQEINEDIKVLERVYHNKRRKIHYTNDELFVEDEQSDEADEQSEEEDEQSDETGMRLRSGRIV